MKRRILSLVIAAGLFMNIVGCYSEADMASHNLSKSAEQFEINRRVVFYNGITDRYMLSIEGRCSVEFYDKKFVVTVKTGPNEYYKHYLGRSDNTFPIVEQLDSGNVNVYRHRVIFRPEVILPNIDLETSVTN